MKNLITFLLFAVLIVGCKSNRNDAVVEKDPCDENARIASLETEVIYLNREIDRLNADLDSCRKHVELKPKAVTKSSTKAVVKKTTTTTTKKAVTPPAPKPAAPQVQRTPTPQSVMPNIDGEAITADARWLKVKNLLIVFKVHVVTGGETQEVYFPQLAIDNNIKVSRVVLNEKGNGHNYLVDPTPGLEGEAGLTQRGIVYHSRSLIETTLQAEYGIIPTDYYIEALGDFNNWGERGPTVMYLMDGYYTLDAN